MFLFLLPVRILFPVILQNLSVLECNKVNIVGKQQYHNKVALIIITTLLFLKHLRIQYVRIQEYFSYVLQGFWKQLTVISIRYPASSAIAVTDVTVKAEATVRSSENHDLSFLL